MKKKEKINKSEIMRESRNNVSKAKHKFCNKCDFKYDGGGWFKCRKCGYSYAR